MNMPVRIAAPVLILLLLSLAATALAAAAPPPTTPPAPPKPKAPVLEKVEIRGECLQLELAADDDARRQGLSGREKLDEHRGMLFVYRDARPRSFWMYDCLIDIDLLYLDATGKIVATHKMKAERPRHPRESEISYGNRLQRYRSRRPAQFVIELKAGSIDRLELKPGQVIKLDLDRLKALAK
jgi:uncharacterized membrane protein (UPF0127 family)